MMVILLLIFLRHLEKNQINGGLAAMQLYTAIAVEIMNALMALVAHKLTKLENHRTQNENDTHELAKVVCFKFLNSYAALYYIAFFKKHEALFGTPMRCIRGDCLLDLQSQLGIFVVLRIFIALTSEYLRPRFSYMYRAYLLEGQSLMSVLAGRSRIHVADMSKAEKQSRDDKFESFGEFDQVLVTHGYATLFAVSSPWVCAATLFACLFGIWLDKTKLLETKQRPLPRKSRSIEPWDSAFEIYGVLAAFTNLFLLIFTSQQYMLWSFTEKLTYFVFLEHWILVSRLVVNQVFPVVPRSIAFLQLKQEAMVHRCLENIKVEAVADLSMFREQKNDEYEVFECDTLEEDMEDMQEPQLDLGLSGRTMFDGIKEQVSRTSRPYPNSPVVSRGQQ
jgi:anoctamin-5